jgi:phage repressor protein C with HTH and peptisase S24 domain
MERERVIAWMKERGLNNRLLADLLGISEDKVSKSLSATGKPRQWQGAEVLKLMEHMNAPASPPETVRTEVRGTGRSTAETHDAWAMKGAKPVPLVGSAFGGDWDNLEGVELTELHLADVLDYMSRPPSLANDPDAYAVEIVGESMSPRFEPGEQAFVSPRSAVRPGDDVVVQLINPRAADDMKNRVVMVLIKRLVRRTATHLELRQYTPDQTFKVPLDCIGKDNTGKPAIHRVRGRL